MKLVIHLGIDGNESVTINLLDNKFVNKWIEELVWCLDNCQINQQEAFADLLSLEESVQVLSDSCNIINSYLPNFIDILDNPLDQPQDYYNYLHTKFEQLNGTFDKPTKLLSLANPELKTAIRNLNFFVHRCESKQSPGTDLYISFDKDQIRRKKLDVSDYNYFDFSAPAGTLFLHYVELGKDFVDLYEDKLSIDYANFKNLHYYSGECWLKFSPYDRFKDPGFLKWLMENKIDPYDKSLGQGKIPLGSVINVESAAKKLQKYQCIKQIEIKDI